MGTVISPCLTLRTGDIQRQTIGIVSECTKALGGEKCLLKKSMEKLLLKAGNKPVASYLDLIRYTEFKLIEKKHNSRNSPD